jgi:hypothetical protein
MDRNPRNTRTTRTTRAARPQRSACRLGMLEIRSIQPHFRHPTLLGALTKLRTKSARKMKQIAVSEY